MRQKTTGNDAIRSILVTAGPTRERIDPVRFISNYSTGTFGYEIAASAARRGFDVTLVSGPVGLKAPRGVRVIAVESASEMRREVKKFYPKAQCVIMAAAVSDWRVVSPSGCKIKRHGALKTLKLAENADILKELGAKKRCILVGFALETGNLEKNAAGKLKDKNLDMIVANKAGAGARAFGSGATDVLIIDRYGFKKMYRRRSKRDLADIILDRVSNFTI